MWEYGKTSAIFYLFFEEREENRPEHFRRNQDRDGPFIRHSRPISGHQGMKPEKVSNVGLDPQPLYIIHTVYACTYLYN